MAADYFVVTGRREFLFGAGALAVAAEVHPFVDCVPEILPGWKPGEFQVHFIYTGVAESQFLIFPDGTTMLLDCGEHAVEKYGAKCIALLPSRERPAGEWVARYVTRVNPNGTDVDYLLTTHFHADHCGIGCAQAAETLHFKKAIDRAWPAYTDPVPIDSKEVREMKALYAKLAERDGLVVEKFRLGARDQIVMQRGGAEDFSVFNIASNGRLCSPMTGEIVDPYKDAIARGARKVDENVMSCGTLFRYGDFTYSTAGDLSGSLSRERPRMEDRLAKLMPKVDVAKINHHGHHAMFDDLAAALDARCLVATVWNRDQMSADTLAALDSAPGPHDIYPDRNPAAVDAHVVLTVAPGGKSYTMTRVTARDETMTIVDKKSYLARRGA